jgi:adenylosuccinate synthase
VIVNPLSMQVEATALAMCGVKDALSKIWVHPECLVTTPFHKALNQVRELSRKHAHGSTGSGIGETVRLGLEYPNLKLQVKDLNRPYTTTHLYRMMDHLHATCCELIHDYDLKGESLDNAMQPFNNKECIVILNERYNDWCRKVNRFCGFSLMPSYEGPQIFEAAQGVMLDAKRGHHPYTTWSRTTDVCARAFSQVDEKDLLVLGVTRTFLTRHGAGPLVTEHPDCLELITDDDNQHGQFQGSLRAGYLDLVTMKYAISCLTSKLDGLAITHCDKLGKPGTSKVCVAHEGVDLQTYSAAEASVAAFEFTKKYKDNKPVMKEVSDLPDFVSKELQIPIFVKSSGKTWKEKNYGSSN